MNPNQVKAPRPTNDLDFQQTLTDPFISSDYMDQSFKDKFREYVYKLDGNGNLILDKDE